MSRQQRIVKKAAHAINILSPKNDFLYLFPAILSRSADKQIHAAASTFLRI
jgi:hypothetical protein